MYWSLCHTPNTVDMLYLGCVFYLPAFLAKKWPPLNEVHFVKKKLNDFRQILYTLGKIRYGMIFSKKAFSAS